MRGFPHRVLTRKIGRDLRRRGAQSAAIAMTVLIGVVLFVASYDSFRNLSTSYQRTYARLHFADFTATGGDPVEIANAVRGDRAVARVSVRTQADVPMTIHGAKLIGRVTGLPPAGAPAVDEIALTAGTLPDPAHPDDVVLEQHTATTFGLGAGARLRVFDGTTWHEVTVSGIARSPEYLWPARSRQDVLDDPHSFAIVFAPQPQALRLSGQPAPDQTLVEISSNATQSDRDRVAARLRAAGALDVTTRAQQPSDAALHEDLSGFSEIAVGFPLLFLLAAAVAEYVLIGRLVHGERAVIGTLLAMGARRGALVRHYTAYGAIVAAIGALAGVLLGTIATSVVTSAYTSALGIPDIVVAHRIGTAVLGFVLGLCTGILAALAPAIAAARTAPAQAMRGNGIVSVRPGRLIRRSTRWDRMPVVARMALRSLARDRRRTAATMTGTVLALVLILASVGMITSMRTVVGVQFGQVERQDASVVVAPGGDITAPLRAIPGVGAVEPDTIAPITVQANGKSYSTMLTGLPPNTTMHGFHTTNGTPGLPADGIVAGAALSHRLGIGVGDILTVTPAFGTPHQVRLTGLVDEPLGTLLYATSATAHTLAPAAAPGYLIRFAAHAQRSELRAAITQLPSVVAYSDTHALADEFNRFLALFWVFIVVMLILGGVLACTVISVTMTVNLAERTTELATLRAAGVPVRRITAALAAENLTATVLAVPVGLAAGFAVAWAFLRSFTSDMFTLHLSLGVLAPVLAVVAVLAAAALSQLPAVRVVQRIDIARVVRERAL